MPSGLQDECSHLPSHYSGPKIAVLSSQLIKILKIIEKIKLYFLFFVLWGFATQLQNKYMETDFLLTNAWT